MKWWYGTFEHAVPLDENTTAVCDIVPPRTSHARRKISFTLSDKVTFFGPASARTIAIAALTWKGPK
jgi:hypothetical protein